MIHTNPDPRLRELERKASTGGPEDAVRLLAASVRAGLGIPPGYGNTLTLALRPELSLLAKHVIETAFLDAPPLLDEYFGQHVYADDDVWTRNSKWSYQSFRRNSGRYWRLLTEHESEEFGYPNYPSLMTPTKDGAWYWGEIRDTKHDPEIVLHANFETYQSGPAGIGPVEEMGRTGYLFGFSRSSEFWASNVLSEHFYLGSMTDLVSGRGGYYRSPFRVKFSVIRIGTHGELAPYDPDGLGSPVRHPPRPQVVQARVTIKAPGYPTETKVSDPDRPGMGKPYPLPPVLAYELVSLIGGAQRRNPDARLRELQRRYDAGDPSALAPLVAELRRTGADPDEVSRLIRNDMVASGEWLPWPTVQRSIDSVWEARSERDLDLGMINGMRILNHVDPLIVVPHLIWRTPDDDGDEDFEYFTDGPYAVRIDLEGTYDNMEHERELMGARPGERGMIPIWVASEVLPSWRGVPQDLPGELMAGKGTVFVDGPVISELPDRTWIKDEGWLVNRGEAPPRIARSWRT